MSAEEISRSPLRGDEATQPELGPSPDARPQDLTLVSISRDGARMLFVDSRGQEFTVTVDDRLRAALPADSPRRSEPSVTEPSSPSLRPRDIQVRIRGGESAEEVAAAAGTSVEKIMAFAAPVLAEREHMAVRAQKASVRRRPGDPANAARTLGEAVAGHLSGLGLDPGSVVWDAYRRPDGKWKLSGSFDFDQRSGLAELTFDTAGNYVALDSDDARWLVGDVVEEPPAPADDLTLARQRRLQPAPVEPAGPSQPAAPAPPAPPAEPTTRRSAPDEPTVPAYEVSPTEDTVEQPLTADSPAEAYLFDAPAAPARREQGHEAPAEGSEPATQAEEKPAEQPAKPKRSRRKRASVPSWDEIMFGGGKSE